MLLRSYNMDRLLMLKEDLDIPDYQGPSLYFMYFMSVKQ